MNRKSRSISRRSSILKIDVNREDDTGIIGVRNRRSSRRVSFAEMCQIKEFPRDSPKVYKDVHSDDDCDAATSGVGSNNPGITGLDKLLTGAIQTPYQDVAEYPIPEMSSESFNIFDINKTVLDAVDMETTQVGGSIDAFLPQMDFQSEPSMELKFDASSFLKSLHGKPNDRLGPMQIYSPNRTSGPSFTSQFNIMEHDKENVIPMDALPSVVNDNLKPQSGVDSKMFLQRLYGGTTRKHEEDHNDMEEMEETACIGDAVRMLTANDDVTKYFNTEDVTVGIEETKCIGGILAERNSVDCQVKMEKENSIHFANQTVTMEETKPVGGILKGGNTALQSGLRMQQGYNTSIHAEDNVTRCFNMEEDTDNGLEETKCVGGILSKGDGKQLNSSGTVSQELSSVGSNLKEDVTVNYNVTGMQDSMEETRTVGSLLHRTLNVTRNKQEKSEIKTVGNCRMDSVNQTVTMEETVPLGKILENGLKRLNFVQSPVNYFAPEELVEPTAAMEETKPVGGILKNSVNDKLNLSLDQREDMEITKNLTVPMEMTRPVGGFLDKSKGKIMFKQTAEESGSDSPRNISVSVEETKAVGGILDRSIVRTAVENKADIHNAEKTVEYTVAMEETRPVGRIFEKTNGTEDSIDKKDDTCHNKTLNEPVPVEETKTVGGILNKTSDRTMYFDDVKTDWLSKDLKADDTGKVSDGTMLDPCNKTVLIEETNCLGGILTNDMEMMKGKFENIYNHAHDDKNNRTVIEPVQMEETRCINEVTVKDGSQIHVNTNTKADFSTADTGDISTVGVVSDSEYFSGKNASDSGNMIVDDEVSFKCSNKRNFDECHGEAVDRNEEKTKEITQTQTGLAKLKEMLILSKRKTAPSLRQGDIRTPSKFSPLFPGSAPGSISKTSCRSKIDLGITRSPVHKRQRLSEQGVDDELDESSANKKAVGYEDDGFSTGIFDNSRMTNANIQGIDDEQMPDTMHIDLCASSVSNDTHSDKNSTVHSEAVSTTGRESNETHSSGNDTRNSSSANLSMVSNFSNKSFAAYSFVVPDGPLSLDTFFKLTVSLVPKIQGTRCSTIFAPSIDMDDMGEVLHAELTLNPLVQAKKKMKEHFTQQIQKSEANMTWLEKSLEETQPEIFQICAKASSEELQVINGQLWSLMSACHKEAEIAWKRGTKQMFTEALHDIQGDGVRKAEGMLQKVVADNQSLDDLLTSLDDEMEKLDRDESRLEELQNKQDVLNREMEKLSLSLQEKSVEEKELHSKLQSLSQKQQADEMMTILKQDIVAHLICCEWNLDELEEDKSVFTFLNDKLELLVTFSPGVEEKQISNIVWRLKSSSDCRYFEDRVATELALNGVCTRSLRQKFTTISSLPKLLHEVSSTVNEIRRFCKDLEDVHLHHVLKFKKNSVCTELWDKDTTDFIAVSFTFDPSHPITSPAEASVSVRIGGLKSSDIEEKLRAVSPGQGYLSRLINAINFKQLHIISVQE